ncbi:hypothetical protein ACI3E1_06970 [Ligilactobacillus sp. LYQ139]|uniref:hypothetical protein n=1 Tax=Ligilactobacillus sp. LYQ139 TaxID=3378800 RepID=UPI003851DB32
MTTYDSEELHAIIAALAEAECVPATHSGSTIPALECMLNDRRLIKLKPYLLKEKASEELCNTGDEVLDGYFGALVNPITNHELATRLYKKLKEPLNRNNPQNDEAVIKFAGVIDHVADHVRYHITDNFDRINDNEWDFNEIAKRLGSFINKRLGVKG